MSNNLQQATDALIQAVCKAGEAKMRADHARVNADPNLFNIAQAHRAAEQDMHAKADAMQAAYISARQAGEITLRGSDG